MYNIKSAIIFFGLILIPFCICELSLEQRDKLLNAFVEYYNRLPNQPYTCEVGYLQNAQKINENCYKIELTIKAVNSSTTKYFKCSTTLQEVDENGIQILNNEYQCTEQESTDFGNNEEVITVATTEEPYERRPVQLDNEVETNTAVTSGEQFIAVPKLHPNPPCIGCSTHINPEAAGVSELAALGAKQLDRHVPNVKHTVSGVLDVERQVQVVNGVRYILTLLIDFDVCKEEKTEACKSTQICKVAVLEKPWVRYADGSKYRAILSNNCTEDWRFGDDGEVIIDISNNNKENNEIDVNPKQENGDDVIKPVHNSDVQSQQNQEKTMTEEYIRSIQQQIIPLNKFNEHFDTTVNTDSTVSVNAEIGQEHATNVGSSKQSSGNIFQAENKESPISEDKKNAIDDLLNFFDSAGFANEPVPRENIGRMRRSYDNDLAAMLLAERFTNIKKSINDAKYVFTIAQTMVDHLNKIDSDLNTKTLLSVLKTEEEYDGDQHYFYIQAQVSVPCDKFTCESKASEIKICNGVINATKQNFNVLSAFCTAEPDILNVDKMENVPVDDLFLQYIAKSAVKKIEKDSKSENALKLNKILSANTQKVSGTLTKLSIVLGYLNCSKTVRDLSRTNCTLQDDMGSKLCEVIIHEKHKKKDQRITYTCTDRPVHVSFSNKNKKMGNSDDPKIHSMVKDALQYLEMHSNKRNRQKVVSVNSVSTQLNAGFITEIDFTVGYTTCTDNYVVDFGDSNSCTLLEDEPLRNCKALIWDRSWIEDGTQIEVSCKDAEITFDINISNNRLKRSLDFVGGPIPKDSNDPQYKELANEALLKFMLNSGNKQHYNLVKVEKVTVQVVAGSLTNIDFVIIPTTCQIDYDGKPTSLDCEAKDSSVTKHCTSKIWDRPWLGDTQITVTCESEKYKRSLQREAVLGGFIDQDPSDPQFFALAQESLHQYLQTSGILTPHKVLKVDKVTTQVVSGIKTVIKFTVTPESGSTGDTFKCESVIWEQSWLKKKEISIECDRLNRKKRGIPGGHTEQNSNDPKYKALAEESLNKYLLENGVSTPHKVVKVDKVTTQVVSGTKTVIRFTVVPESGSTGDTFKCESDIWEQSWLKKKEISIECDRLNRKKRGIPGGHTEQNSNDPKYKALAEESLNKYLLENGVSTPHKVVKVDKVTTQVVSGTKTVIRFTVVPESGSTGDTFKCESDIWEQSWLKKKEISIECDRLNRKKRGIPGGHTEQNSNDPKYKALAEESLNKYLLENGVSTPHKVVKVDKVTTQVVSGTKTVIRFTVVPESGSTGDTFKCESDIWEQSWLKKKEISIECDRLNRKKRGIPGGHTEQNSNDPKYKALAEESLNKYLLENGVSTPHKVVKVDKVTTQVVSGTKTVIRFTVVPESGSTGDTFKCESDIWEQSWLKKKEISIECDRLNRKKRGIPGGHTEQNSNDPKYKALAEKSLNKYLLENGVSTPHKVVKVDKVTTQVVSGTKTVIRFTVVPESGSTGETFKCESDIWEQSWLKKKEISIECDRLNRKKRGIPGGHTEQNSNDPKYKALAEESLNKYLLENGVSTPHKVVKVDKVTTQVVSGTKTVIRFTVVPESGSTGDTFKCESDIWEQSWLKKKEISIECDRLNRKKRGIPGGHTEQNSNDPKYKALAEESLNKYLLENGVSTPHKVVKVDKVTTQVVSGTKTVIRFTVVPESGSTGDTFKCESDIWEQSWLKKKEISIECDRLNRKKRGIPGGHTEQNSNDPKYKALAEESLNKYLLENGVSTPHKVVKVDKVTTQVVSGTKTVIRFTVVPESGSTGDTFKCESDIWEQSWLKKKEISIECDRLNRKKRGIPGGHTEQNSNDPKYKALAEESLNKYLLENGVSTPHKVVKVDKVTTQVVSGTKTVIRFTVVPESGSTGDTFKCESDIWEQSWLKKKEISIECDRLNRKKRGIPGGHTEQNSNDPKYKALAEESLNKYLLENGVSTPHKVVKVDKVTTQVVSGTKTVIGFTVVPESGSTGDTFKCESDIWEQSWLKKKEISIECDRLNRKKRGIPGGHTEQNSNDPKYKALAEESLNKYLLENGVSTPHKVVKVDKVTTQVVSGTKTVIGFTVVPESGSTGDTFKCESDIWEQSWLKKKEISIECDRLNRKKRGIPGDHTEQNSNDPKYKALAEESLNKYLLENGVSTPHKVVKVDKVTTQVVSGTKTVIRFTVVPESGSTGDTFKCESDIWEQSWLKKKEISIECDRLNRKKRGIPGGHTEQNSNDPKYKALAEESLNKYLLENGVSTPHKVVKVDKVTTQVVSGTKTVIRFTVVPESGSTADTFKCESDIWEQSWLKKKEISIECDRLNRKKRGIPGGHTEQNSNDPKYKALAEESLNKYLLENGVSTPHKVVKVDKVTTQVVSGTKTVIRFTVVPESGSTGDTFKCESDIWEQSWLKKKEISIECDRLNRKKRGIPGGHTEQNSNDPKYKTLAEESLKKYLLENGVSTPHKVVKVDKVTTQVVSGIKTVIKFTVTPESGSTGDTFKCESVIWEQSWLKKKEIHIHCQPNINGQIKNNGFGRYKEHDPNDPQYMVLAQEALAKYVLTLNTPQNHRVFQVDKVLTHIVSGIHTLINFKAIPEEGGLEDMLDCRTDIWEKVWLNRSDIDVECRSNKYMVPIRLNQVNQNVVSPIINMHRVAYLNSLDNLFTNKATRMKREVLNDDKKDIFERRPTTVRNSNSKKVGNVQEQDPTKSEYKILAQKSLQQYAQLENSNKAYKVIEVKKVRMQVVSGKIFEIDFKAAPTTCSAEIDLSILENCEIENTVLLFCHTNVWSRPWLRKDEIVVHCTMKHNETNEANTQLKHIGKKIQQNKRRKREVYPDEDDIEEDSKNYYADLAIQRLNQISDSHNLYKLVTIHTVKKRTAMESSLIMMYIEVAETYCLRHADEGMLPDCEELDGMDHKNCLARLTPSPDDELIIVNADIICDDDKKFEDVTGISLAKLLQASITRLESSPQVKNKIVHIGDPQWIPTLDPDVPVKLNFIVATTNCSKDIDFIKKRTDCFYDISIPSKVCNAFIWLAPFTNKIDYVQASCQATKPRTKRSLGENSTEDTVLINQLVQLSLDKLEMTSQHRYKQRLLRVNSYSTKILSGKVTTIDFDVGYTSCLKYEWVENVTSCEFLEHLPRRHCVSEIWERLWLNNGRNIEVKCEDDETPLESHIEFESAEMGMQLAKEALKHIEAKYPNPRKQQVVRIFTLEKQVVAGLHYRMKIEVGSTNCFALSAETNCKIDKDAGLNKFCRVNVWLRPWTDHPPNFRVQCDYQDTATGDVYQHVQAEYLFFNYLTTYKPEYINDHREMGRRFDIFKNNIRRIHELNTHERGTATYGITRFADLTYEEFSTKYMGLKPKLKEDNQLPMRRAEIPKVEIPDNFDWRDFDAVTAVKDQGSCGSCWAFSVTGNIEGQWKMQSGQLLSLSEQELVDCDKMDQGCNGGLMDNAYRAIEQLGGLEMENDYPYEGEDDKCVFNKTLSKVQISGAVNISSNETDMAKWLVKNGPISIGINANAMQFYMGGISHPWRMLCNPSNLDHGVLVVGYGIKDYPLFNKRLPYWIVKNSWGTSWGEQGYYRVFRGDGTCGVNQMASSAVI